MQNVESLNLDNFEKKKHNFLNAVAAKTKVLCLILLRQALKSYFFASLGVRTLLAPVPKRLILTPC